MSFNATQWRSIQRNREKDYLDVGGAPNMIWDPLGKLVCAKTLIVSEWTGLVDPTIETESVALIVVRIIVTLYHLPSAYEAL